MELAEINGLLKTTAQFAERTGGISFDANGYADLMDRVRSLYVWPDLEDDLREAMRSLLDRDDRWTRDRERVGGFLEAARKVENARNDLVLIGVE